MRDYDSPGLERPWPSRIAPGHSGFKEQTLSEVEQRFAAVGDLVARLFTEEKRQRILSAAERWPKLLAASIANIASAR